MALERLISKRSFANVDVEIHGDPTTDEIVLKLSGTTLEPVLQAMNIQSIDISNNTTILKNLIQYMSLAGTNLAQLKRIDGQ